MLKVIVDRSLCAGHALCHLVGPGPFPLAEDGAVARSGMTACPEQAISVFKFE